MSGGRNRPHLLTDTGTQIQTYVQHPLSGGKEERGEFWGDTEPRDYIIKSEEYGIPQTRHRVILLGVCADLHVEPGTLVRQSRLRTTWEAISCLPRLRSTLSKEPDSPEAWRRSIYAVAEAGWLHDACVPPEVRRRMIEAASALDGELTPGGEFVPCPENSRTRGDWYRDRRVRGYCNHAARSHMREDLLKVSVRGVFRRGSGFNAKTWGIPDEIAAPGMET